MTADPTSPARTDGGTLTVNGQDTPHRAASCRDLVAERTGRPVADDGTALDGGRLGLAVAVDGAVVPRSAWAATVPAPGANVEIITAVQGG